MNLAPDFDEFCALLKAHRVEFVVVGAHALAHAAGNGAIPQRVVLVHVDARDVRDWKLDTSMDEPRACGFGGRPIAPCSARAARRW